MGKPPDPVFRIRRGVARRIGPYFKAGLELPMGDRPGIQCRGRPIRVAGSGADLHQRERNRQIEIADADTWYSAGQKLQPHDIVAGLLKREHDVLGAGFVGLRTNGNYAWVSRDQWEDFQEYEALVHKAIRGRRMICMCSYCLDQFHDSEYQDVMDRHDRHLPTRVQEGLDVLIAPALRQKGFGDPALLSGQSAAGSLLCHRAPQNNSSQPYHPATPYARLRNWTSARSVPGRQKGARRPFGGPAPQSQATSVGRTSLTGGSPQVAAKSLNF